MDTYFSAGRGANSRVRYLAVILALFCSAAQAWGPYPAKLERVIDGDTVQAMVQVYPDVWMDVSIRVAGENAPELHGQCAVERALALDAKKQLAGLLGDPGSPFRLTVSVLDSWRRAVGQIDNQAGVAVNAIMAQSWRPYAPGQWRDGYWCRESN